MTRETQIAILQYGYAFFGVGKSEGAAVKDARQWVDGKDDLRGIEWGSRVDGEMTFVEITPKLADAIKKRGGAISYDELPDGTLCLPEEA